MKILLYLICGAAIAMASSCTVKHSALITSADTVLTSDTIQYHPVRINKDDGSILPWFSADKGRSYDTVLMLVWDFWNKMGVDSNGLRYFMNHQVWKPDHDMRGLGGDQISMALSSWRQLYAYTGNSEVLENMKYLADTYLERSLSGPADNWPTVPYPYNTVIHSGRYDGDMRNGKGITQPDKAGNFGYELVMMFKMTGDEKYLLAAEKIASTLMDHISTGDSLRSPLPFRVNAKTGETGLLVDGDKSGKITRRALYTSDWVCTMMLFRELEYIDKVNSDRYEKSFNIFLDWMKAYPLRLNKWGPFFEDIPGWSNTQTNAVTFACFIMEHRDLFPEWKADVRSIFDWTYRELGNHEYEKFKVTVMNEQTVYKVPGNSHSSRQASAELLYTALSGDTAYKANAIRTLNWATYTVAADGRNRYIRDDIWLTDGYGDYVRHYLRAMAAMPELAPADRNRLLRSSSVVCRINYARDSITYSIFDPVSSGLFRLTGKPSFVRVDGKMLEENPREGPYWTWKPLDRGGLLELYGAPGRQVTILF